MPHSASPAPGDATTPPLMSFARHSSPREYLLAIVITAVTSAVGLLVAPRVGYASIGMMYLLALMPAGLILGRNALLFMALLCAAGWDYFFIPPIFAFGIGSIEDLVMCAIFVVAVFTVFALLLRQRTAMERSQQLAELSRASDRLRHTLLDSVSHELKTPLAALQSATDEMSNNPAEAAGYVPELRGALRRLRRTVDNLLNMTRLESGAIEPLLDWCDVDELCDASVELIGDTLAGHRFYENVPKHLPLVKIDRALIEQALVNLLLNAAMHTPKGCEVILRAKVENHRLELSVLDRGPGLPPGDPELLFQKFARGQSAPAGGSGLGLAIARGFAVAHGGNATARQRSGGGAEFSLTLPVETLDQFSDESFQTESADH